MTSNNKIFSSKQEKMVADFMGWKVITGSGARPFNPGDVNNDHFLVECKTHVEEQENIVFQRKHWEKITEEARAKNRYPALVVDNGTQKSKNTWVMIPKRMLDDSKVFKIYGLRNTARSDNTITFKHNAAVSLYKVGHNSDRISYFPEWCNGEQIAIMTLDEFRNFYVQEFEC